MNELRVFTLAAMLGLMLAEARTSRRHVAWLLSHGAVAPPGDVYAAMAVLYPAAFLGMGLEGIWRGADGAAAAGMFVSGALMFLASKALKYWAIGALRERWSFRVLVLPGVPLVRSGPYRYVSHPNYIAVVGELGGAAMMMHAQIAGPLALVVFGGVLWARVRFERRVLREMTPRVSGS